MKRGTLAKRIGYHFLRKYRVPFLNQKGNTVRMKSTEKIRLKYASSINEIEHYYNIKPKQNVKNGRKLAEALGCRIKSTKNHEHNFKKLRSKSSNRSKKTIQQKI